jgi:hypothetical protein
VCFFHCYTQRCHMSCPKINVIIKKKYKGINVNN